MASEGEGVFVNCVKNYVRAYEVKNKVFRACVVYINLCVCLVSAIYSKQNIEKNQEYVFDKN